MTILGYEIKHGKHIAFKHKDKERFTRSKVIGIDYTEDRLKNALKKMPTIGITLLKSVLEIS